MLITFINVETGSFGGVEVFKVIIGLLKVSLKGYVIGEGEKFLLADCF
ncbi:MAG: hypothetical protein ACUVXA_01780 [Candidatus Jordarchaeum sp.]